MRRIALLTVVASLALAPAAARAEPPAGTSIAATASPCYVHYCAATLRYDPAQLADPPAQLQIAWDHQGPPDGPLTPNLDVQCGTARSAPGDPLPTQYPCTFNSPPYATAGTHLVVLEVRLKDGTTTRGSQAITVVDLPAPPAPAPPVSYPPPVTYPPAITYPPPTTPSYQDPVESQSRPVRKTPARKTPRRTKRPRRPSGGGYALCANTPANVRCQPGGGRQTAGGGEKVSHKGWPRIDGVFWQVMDNAGRRKTGGPDNDELLGHHGSDRLNGMAGKDVLWGDWDPAKNNSTQHDVLRGGAGDDFIYPSHGRTEVYGGAGRDYVWAFYGQGLIDCGPGYDTVRVRTNGAFKLRGCEVVGHFCQYGPNGNGGCLKPGESRRTRRRSAG